MKQLNHFDNYGFVLPKIAAWYYRYTDQYGRVDMGLKWNPMGSIVLEFGYCKSTINTMPGLAEMYWNQLGNIPYYQTENSANPVGGFSSNIYYVRAYVRNVAGIAWSDAVIVNTRDLRVYAPTVTTNSLNYIYSTRALGGGNVTNDGGAAVTERGLCWNTNSGVLPTTSNDRTIEGSGTGSFSSNIRNLTPNTTYYVRAYAINSVDTAYGNVISFQTNAAGVPYAIIIDLLDIAATSVIAYGRIYDNGGSVIIQKGFVWNTTGDPTKENGHTVLADGSGDADYYKAMTGLPPDTRIYAKAFGVNSYGTGYGDQTIFSTPEGAGTNKIVGIVLNLSVDGGKRFNTPFYTFPAVPLPDGIIFGENILKTLPTSGTSYYDPPTTLSGEVPPYPTKGDTVFMRVQLAGDSSTFKAFDYIKGHKMRYLISSVEYTPSQIDTIVANSIEIPVSNSASLASASFSYSVTDNQDNFIYMIWDYRV